MFMPRDKRVKRAICDSHVVFQQSDLPLPTGGLSNPIFRMGRSPAHVQACWAGILGDVISLHFWEGYPYRSLYMYNYAGY